MTNGHNDIKRYWAIIAAAGVGRRMNDSVPKQYLKIKGKTILEHTVERFIQFPLLEKIIVVLARDDCYAPRIRLLNHKKVIKSVGGGERVLSVISGLKVIEDISDANDWVMVHDAARPCVRQADLEWLVECLRGHDVGGLLGVKVRDTVKRASADCSILETVDRSALWRAFTPQMFKREALTNALTQAVFNGLPVTDEASAMEFAGYKPMMVEGHADNIKITMGDDLAMAALYMEQQNK